MIRIGLIQFPGSNCERETALAVKRAGMEPVEILWNEPLAKLQAMDGYILIGGFSYEDRSRAGIIAAMQPIIQEIKHCAASGKPVLGICNGAQILVEAGMVPGLPDCSLNMALTENKRLSQNTLLGTGFYNNWVSMRLSDHYKPNAFTRHLSSSDIIHLPIAHAQGRFVMPPALMQLLEEQGLNLFQYCDEDGKTSDYFPVNPNGSMGNLAAVSNAAGNVMAMMPHPERTKNGDRIFTSMREYIASHQNGFLPQTVEKQGRISEPLVGKTAQVLPAYVKKPGRFQCLVRLNITDNQASTVEKTLRQAGFSVRVQRFIHWEIDCDSEEILRQIKKTGLLYCDRKEQECSLEESDSARACLVRPKDDVIGREALQHLTTYYEIPAIKTIAQSILWQFKSEKNDICKLMDNILLTTILGNQYAHDCYLYDPALS